MAKNNYYVGLVHHPVYNKHKQVVTTSITNMDVHDISRTCRTYGIRNYFLINQLESQRKIFEKIILFWESEQGKTYQPDRAEALKIIVFSNTIQKVKDYIKNQENAYPLVITTTAQNMENQIQYNCFSSQLRDDKPVLLLFGTGYGLAEEIHKQADYVLTPIESNQSFNHLSVRSAVAIVLDRLIPKNKGGINGHSTISKQGAN